MPFYFFDWTPENIEHLAEHDVTPEEFEDVVSAPLTVRQSRSSENLVALGWSSTGRYLCCIYRLHDFDTRVEPISAYDVEY